MGQVEVHGHQIAGSGITGGMLVKVAHSSAATQATSARMMMDKLTLVRIMMTVNPCSKRFL